MFDVAVVGATGAVGSTMLRVLEERGFPVTRLVPLASARSAGTRVDYLGKPFEVQELGEDAFEGVQIALFSAGGARSRSPAACVALPSRCSGASAATRCSSTHARCSLATSSGSRRRSSPPLRELPRCFL